MNKCKQTELIHSHLSSGVYSPHAASAGTPEGEFIRMGDNPVLPLPGHQHFPIETEAQDQIPNAAAMRTLPRDAALSGALHGWHVRAAEIM